MWHAGFRNRSPGSGARNNRIALTGKLDTLSLTSLLGDLSVDVRVSEPFALMAAGGVACSP